MFDLYILSKDCSFLFFPYDLLYGLMFKYESYGLFILLIDYGLGSCVISPGFLSFFRRQVWYLWSCKFIVWQLGECSMEYSSVTYYYAEKWVICLRSKYSFIIWREYCHSWKFISQTVEILFFSLWQKYFVIKEIFFYNL